MGIRVRQVESCDKYQLIDLVGSGGSGKVYRARAKDDSRASLVALKLLSEAPLGLDRTGPILHELDHPHLCRLLDWGEDPKAGHFVVYQFLEGLDLEAARANYDQGKVPLRTVLRWAADALKGLAVLHGSGLLHGDIKPSNLMLCGQQVVVCDLTTAIPREGPLDFDLRSGTPVYLTPEETEWRLPRRDLYALGLTVAGLLLGELPEEPQTLKLSERDPLLGPAVDRLVERSLGGDQRFESAQEMADAVEALLGTGVKVGAASTNLSPPTRRVELSLQEWKAPLWPWLVALLMLPLGYGLREYRTPRTPQAATASPTALLTGIGVEPHPHRREVVWQTTILGRPVVCFLGGDPVLGEATARSRAEWCAAVLEEAHFQNKSLRFEYREEQPKSCQVWLTSAEHGAQLLFSVTPAESDHFDRPAPALARFWAGLVEDTADLARPGARGGERSAGALMLAPWQRRFETLTADQGELSQAERVRYLALSLTSLEQDVTDELLTTALKPPEVKE